MNKKVEYEDGLQIAYIEPTKDPFLNSWMICSNCYESLFEKNHVPDIMPSVCPKCLCILKTNKIKIQ